MRGFLTGTPDTGQTFATIAWSVAIILVSFFWARANYGRRA